MHGIILRALGGGRGGCTQSSLVHKGGAGRLSHARRGGQVSARFLFYFYVNNLTKRKKVSWLIANFVKLHRQVTINFIHCDTYNVRINVNCAYFCMYNLRIFSTIPFTLNVLLVPVQTLDSTVKKIDFCWT